MSAFEVLYQRHLASARWLAHRLAAAPTDVEDLVSEAFTRVLTAIHAGRGPKSAFRAYLLMTLRNAAYDKANQDRRLTLVDDVTGVQEPPSEPVREAVFAAFERDLVSRAFAQLPARWQEVLWLTEIEKRTPAQIAPMLHLTPNGVSALAYRAREGLRRAYLQAHLADTAEESCREAILRLGAWIRDGLSRGDTGQVERHLRECSRCWVVAAELADINATLRGSAPMSERTQHIVGLHTHCIVGLRTRPLPNTNFDQVWESEWLDSFQPEGLAHRSLRWLAVVAVALFFVLVGVAVLLLG
ncbi:MAG TPA: sigma-70 family RNA polymerase sigma factor [Actinophytocola sp.]|uniref:sigma-70 family RNA polymerase sigma factor n=1 Tax=Actinophytocola sp. TaxID=1872138 RepID=UPI002DDD1FB7|nr:sigma-70 family RNA polymerase sigma factor [Actinophytocola sp.]HEV2779695.1 sigma-70 family RNA polymerase sigma factor [Actinophytocola sp.]